MVDLNAATHRMNLQRLIDGYQLSQAVSVAARLGIADLLAERPRTVDELARATGAHPESLLRLLRALASMDVFTEESAELFGLTPLAEGLRSDVPGTLKAWAIQSGQPYMWEAYGQLEHSIMTGESAFRKAHGIGAWDYRERHPSAGETFDNAMQEGAQRVSNSLVGAYDFSRVGMVVDVGGGNGALLAAILEANPDMHGILYDQLHVVSRAEALLEHSGAAPRCSIVPGDFFDSVPAGGSLYILKGIIHDWDDAHARQILRNCRYAMSADSTLLLIEQVLPSDGMANPFTSFMDLHMLAIHGARERNQEEYTELLASVGLNVARVLPTATGLHLIEAVAT